MKDKIKEIFNQVQAEEELKEHTRAFLERTTRGYTVHAAKRRYAFAASIACFIFLLAGGYWLYFVPIAEINIDINPSIALGVNRYDQIVSVDGINEDGRELIQTLDIKYNNYSDAIEKILGNQGISLLLSENEVMTITVSGSEETHSAKIYSGIESCTAEQKNTYCYLASSEEAAAARETGLPYGKYRIYLEIRRWDPEITPEAVRTMTMRELRDLLEKLSEENGDETSSDENWGYKNHGLGGCQGRGQGKGRGRGYGVGK